MRWILGTLEKRIEGFQDVDLGGITEKLQSLISLPDAGLVGRGDADEVDAAVIDPALRDEHATAPAAMVSGSTLEPALASASASASTLANGPPVKDEFGSDTHPTGGGGSLMLSVPETIDASGQTTGLGAQPQPDVSGGPSAYGAQMQPQPQSSSAPGLAVPSVGSHADADAGADADAVAGLADMSGLNGSAAAYGMLPQAPPLLPPASASSSLFPSDFDFLSMPFDLGNPEGTQTITDLPADAWLTDWFK